MHEHMIALATNSRARAPCRFVSWPHLFVCGRQSGRTSAPISPQRVQERSCRIRVNRGRGCGPGSPAGRSRLVVTSWPSRCASCGGRESASGHTDHPQHEPRGIAFPLPCPRRKRRFLTTVEHDASSMPERDHCVRPTLPGCLVGRACDLKIFDASNMVNDVVTGVVPDVDTMGKENSVPHYFVLRTSGR